MATIFVAVLINTTNQSNNGFYGLTIFPEKGECITTSGEIEVFQVLEPHIALARTGDIFDGIVVLILNYDGKSYYDDQKIKVPTNKCARQIGTYQYTTRQDGFEKTVPAIVIE
ncbi:MAG: hypothetical protein LBR81_04535 [Prevotellaceae bacterium]|nr:hypothetical protein [Prevotellaceae bacterium]